MEYIIFIISMSSLVYGANHIVIESEKIALHFEIPAFIIGATIIALGTSLPEMAASVTASYQGKSDMAVANILGSVTFNISLVLGFVFLMAKNLNPIRDIFRNDSVWIIAPPILFLLMAYDGKISRLDGLIFIFLMVSYLLFLNSDKKHFEDGIDEEALKEKFAWTKTSLLLTTGFIFVIVGAQYAIKSASQIALDFGVSEWVIGLLLIAFGTSLPELVVSIVAVRKNNADMAIGNIIGSNVANFAVVLGSAAIVNPLTVDSIKNGFDVACVFASSIILIYITATKLYSKPAGIILLSIIVLMINHSFNIS